MADGTENTKFPATLQILTGLAAFITTLIALIAALINQGIIHKAGTNATTRAVFLQQLHVDPASQVGTIYTYPKTEKPARLRYEATGKWRPIPIGTPGNVPTGDVDARGYTEEGVNFNPIRPCGYKFNLGALVVMDLDSPNIDKCIAGGLTGNFEAQPGESYRFLMSDTYYLDNKGDPMEVHIYKESDMK